MKSLICFLFCIATLPAFSQKLTLSGYLIDSENGEAIIGAHVFNKQSGLGTVSNNYGYYSLSTQLKESLHIRISHLGYTQIDTTIIVKNKAYFINFNLVPEFEKIQGITVSADKRITETDEMSLIKLSIKDIKKLPMVGAEYDILKAFQYMPGVQSGKEGSSGLIVRGGSSDQNLIVLDDVPLYHVNHLAGFLSVFNPDAINTIKMYTGGFPARYGSRLSSVLDIRTKKGNNQQFNGNATMGLISSRITLEGPLKKDTSSYLVSFRRFIPDLFLRPIMNYKSDVNSGYNFYDGNLKLSYNKNKHKLFFTLYNGADKFNTSFKNQVDPSETAESKIQWGNTLATIRWNQAISPSLYSTLIGYYSKYRYSSLSSYESSTESKQTINEYTSGVEDFGLKYKFEQNISESYRINYGLDLIYHRFTPGFSRSNLSNIDATEETAVNKEKHTGFENAIYLENHFSIGSRMKANLGYRFVVYHINETNYFSGEPRLLINYSIAPKLSLKASYSKMNQYIHLLSSSGLGLPTDLWMPATENIPPQFSRQIAMGIAAIPHHNYELTVEAYYKTLNNLITMKEGVFFFSDNSSWQEKVEKGGVGYSTGLEFHLKKNSGRLTGWMSYTLSKAELKFESINHADYYPANYDRRHDLSLVFMYQINKNIDASCVWVYGSGYPITLAFEAHQKIDNTSTSQDLGEILIFEHKNNYRMRDYHRMDIGLNFKKVKKRGTRIWNLSIYNLYNRKNPFYYFTRTSSEGLNRTTKLYQYSLFPILPSISYSYIF
ncbi:MAG: TonB-dependent receptor [Bacteroidota bacterium]|nr:TonB-dependent receptor [Bacteroidota bacterium]